MLISKTKLSLLFILFPFLLNAQKNYGSCETALEICSKGPLQVFYVKQPSDKNFEGFSSANNNSCINVNEATWISWEIAKSGYLSFSISPTHEIIDDLDFALFRLHKEKGCKRKKVMRCMQSGFNLDDNGYVEHNSIKCAGSTGLTVAEKNSRMEGIGCASGDNNFVSSIYCEAGEKYALAVTSYGEKMHNFFFDICGSAELTCDSIFCEETTPTPSMLPYKQMVSFLGKSSDDILAIKFLEYEFQPVTVEFKDEEGNTKIKETFRLNDKDFFKIVNIRNLSPGEYTVTINLKDQELVGRFQKT